MAGQHRLGRRTPSETQRLLQLGRQTTTESRASGYPAAVIPVIGEAPSSSGMRRKESSYPHGLSGADTRRDGRPASSVKIEIDDEAETRLYRPRTDSPVPLRLRRSSSPAPSSDRPSRRPGIVSKPGALIMIPADVPSVRVLAESDVDLVVTHGGEGTGHRRRSLTTTLLTAAIGFTVLLFVAHEIAAVLHLHWLDPGILLQKIRSIRAR